MKLTSTLIMLVALASTATYTSANDASEAAKTCVACHGETGVSVNPAWPNLAGQKPGYLVEQLKSFKAGERTNPLMAPLVANLTDQQINDLARYYARQAPVSAASGSASLVAEGERLSAYCVACHGMTGHSINKEWPNLAGQQADYLIQQLMNFKSGERFNPQMQNVIRHLDEPQFTALAAYYSQLKTDWHSAQHKSKNQDLRR